MMLLQDMQKEIETEGEKEEEAYDKFMSAPDRLLMSPDPRFLVLRRPARTPGQRSGAYRGILARCYCDGSSGDLGKGAEEATQKIAELSSKLEALKAEKTQLEQELAGHQNARAQAGQRSAGEGKPASRVPWEAKQDQSQADSIRGKENAEFTAAEADMSKNIAAMEGAISALEKGLGSFLQMPKDQLALVQRAR